jgi:hypothetical protein
LLATAEFAVYKVLRRQKKYYKLAKHIKKASLRAEYLPAGFGVNSSRQDYSETEQLQASLEEPELATADQRILSWV